MKTLKSFFTILSLCLVLASCEKQENYSDWKPEPINPDKIRWEECLAVSVDKNKVNVGIEPFIPSARLDIAVVGKETLGIIEDPCLLRIVNYGDRKIPFTTGITHDLREYEEVNISGILWWPGLGHGDKTPDAKYISEDLPARPGTYEFAIELIKLVETQYTPHYRSPHYRITMAKNGEEWSLNFEQVK